MTKTKVYPLICCLLFFLLSESPGQGTDVRYDEALYSGMQWRLIGPFRGGRAGTCAGVRGKPFLHYQGTAGGGVWKTADGGNTWECISDGYFGGTIGAVAVAPSDPQIIYVGEGEQTLRGNVSSGENGLWRSDDAGKTWKNLGLAKTEHIGRIIIHPDDPHTVYVAAIGNLWIPNVERGLYKTIDGGENWEKVLYIDEKSGVVDVCFNPENPRELYAGSWQMKRNGYRMDSGGPGSHLWKSTDSGSTWQKLSDHAGLPDSTWGIVGVAVSHVRPERVWAMIEAKDGGLFRSDDAGKTWTKVNEDRALRQRAWYYTRVYADTQNEDRVYVLNVGFHRSGDGGKTFERIKTPHGDHHDLWIDPDDNRHLLIADDGGAQVSYDGGDSWSTYYNQPTAQFYRVTTDNHFPYRIYGAQQDNSTMRIYHRVSGSAITDRDWEPSAGGESAHLAPDPENPEVVYGGTYKGYMMRLDHSTGQTRSTNVWPFNPAGSGAEVMKYRFNWNYPIFFSPHDPDKLYACSNHLHVSYNEGESWEELSPDLTRNDPETIRSSGGPITQDNTGAEYYANIFAGVESPYEEGLIWVGSDDGLVHVSRDGGINWENVTPSGSPRLNMMNCIEVNPFVPGGAYLAATSYKFGDYTPYLYKTNDYGQSWQLITSGIDGQHYTRAIRADPDRQGLLYAGTERGMYLSFDDGANWSPFQLNLPITSIRDLHIRDHNLIAATHGRSFWMLDDLTPLHQLSDEIREGSHYLFAPKPAIRMGRTSTRDVNRKRMGENHPHGVIFHYYIKDLVEDATVKLEILELDGRPIQTFYSNSDNTDSDNPEIPAKVGGNRFVWDMRYPGFTEFPGMVLYSSPNNGPKAMPGKYLARLTINEESIDQVFEILKDPRTTNTPEDYQRQFDFLISVRDKVSEAHRAILDIRSLKKDINYVKSKLESDAHKPLIEEIDAYEKKLIAIENNIHQTKNKSYQDPLNYGIKLNNTLAFLMRDQQRGDFPPTVQAEQVFKELTGKLDIEIRQLETLLSNDLIELNKRIEGAGVRLLMSTRNKS